MKIEERLSDAMHDYADAIEPSTDSWSAIAARFDDVPAPRRPSRRPLVLTGVALAIVVVLVAGLLVRDTGDDTRVVTGPVGAGGSMPSRILAITVDGSPVVLDSSTGARDFGYGGSYAEGTQIAVTPNGQVAYLVAGNGNKGCADHSILELQIGSGSGSRVVATEASDPTVSPDGRYLAYLHCLPGDNRADQIVVRDLTAAEAERVTPAPAGTFFINRLEFAADSRHVLFDLFEDSTGRATLREADIVAGEAPPGRDVGVVVGGQGWVGVRGTTGEYLGVKGSPPGVLSMQGPSPFTASPLFTLPGIPTQVVSDASGRDILAVVDHTLYRWSEGDEAPTKLFGNYAGGAWIPDAPAPDRRTADPASAPNGVLAVIGGKRLAVLDSADGREQSPLDSFTDISSVSDRFDEGTGAYSVFFASTDRSGACGNDPGPDVSLMTVITSPVGKTPFLTLETRSIVGGALAPSVSPDGKLVAYGIWCDGRTLGFTAPKGGKNFRTDPLAGTTSEVSKQVEIVEPLGWSPDSTRLLYRLGLKGDQKPHYYVGRLWPFVRQAETRVIELPAGPDSTAAAFVDNDTVAVAQATGALTEVRSWRVVEAGDERTRRLFEVPGRVTSIAADRAGRHFLAVTSGGGLYRWSRGDAAPTKLADGVTAAAWLSGP
jgi:WD40-like Beta Propeller Repeat